MLVILETKRQILSTSKVVVKDSDILRRRRRISVYRPYSVLSAANASREISRRKEHGQITCVVKIVHQTRYAVPSTTFLLISLYCN